MGMKSSKYKASGKGTRSAYNSIDAAMRSYRAAPPPMAAFSMPDDIPEEDNP
jgi:hypothetical protein